MKIVLILITVLVVVHCGVYDYSFLLDPWKISNVTLEFRTSYTAYQLQVKCDSYQNYLWYSSNYGYVQVSPEQRNSYKCSDTNFTLSVSSDFQDDELIVLVYDYNNMTEIGRYYFVNDQYITSKNQLTQDKATQYYLYYQDKNDYQISLTYPSTVYVEIFKCPSSSSNLKVKAYDDTHQYKNITPASGNYFYDVFNATDGNFYYRIGQIQHSSPDIFIKYQRTYQQDLRYINKYVNQTYVPSAEVKQDKVILQIPTIQTWNSEQVTLHIYIYYENYGNTYMGCSFGDNNLENQYNYYSESQSIQQNSYDYVQEVVMNFPTSYDGFYNVQVSALVQHGTIKQTIPYQTIQVYQNISFNNNLLIYILAPVFVSVLALFGMIVGGCKYRYKKKQQQEIEQQQLLENASQQSINRNYLGVQ